MKLVPSTPLATSAGSERTVVVRMAWSAIEMRWRGGSSACERRAQWDRQVVEALHTEHHITCDDDLKVFLVGWGTTADFSVSGSQNGTA